MPYGPTPFKTATFHRTARQITPALQKKPALIQQKTVYLQSQGWFVASKNPATLDLGYSE